MYRFSLAESVSARTMEVTREIFHEVISREKVKDVCEQIAQAKTPEEVSRLKRKLPAFCWHAWFPDGKRKNYNAQPSGMIMIDADHVEEPRAVFEQTKEKALEAGLLVAHITPSGHGLRYVFPLPEGMSMEQAQAHYARLLNLQVDACTKDLARLSFCVPQDYFLYVDEERLFEGDEAATVVVDNPQPEAPVQTQEEAVQVVAEAFPEEYDGIPYQRLVESLQDMLGGVPAHGSRNNFIFSMACHLRYLCNDDPRWIANVLPTYGEAHDKWLRTIESACQRAQYRQMPQIVIRAINNARHKYLQMQEREDESCNMLPPKMPEKLPPVIAHLVKNVPEVCRPAVACAVFPALATHLHKTKFWLIDGTEKEATMMCVNLSRQSSGKSAINKPIEYIMADIVERDEINRRREQEWKDTSLNRASTKEKPRRPDDLIVQVLVSDMTNAAFVQRMRDAGEHYLYTNLEELELLKQLQTNGTKDVGKIICLCFDNGVYGQERVGSQSVTCRTNLRWNWNASSTIQKGIQFFRGRLVDGTLSRLSFCTIIPDRTKPFVYGRYDEEYAQELKPYINNLNLATGNIECEEALQLARELQAKCEEEAILSDDEVLQDLTYRAVTIAYLKSMILYICNDMEWSDDIAEFTRWSLEYDLFCKNFFFGACMREDKARETVRQSPGRQNLLNLLPDVFTLQEAQEVRQQQGLDNKVHTMIRTWIYRGYVERDEITQRYSKTDAYLKRTA